MEPIGCPETSVWKYQSTLRNIPEERRSHLRRGGGLKSQVRFVIERMYWLYTDNIFITWHIRGKEIVTDVMVGSDEEAEYCYAEINWCGEGAAKYPCKTLILDIDSN